MYICRVFVVIVLLAIIGYIAWLSMPLMYTVIVDNNMIQNVYVQAKSNEDDVSR